MKKIFIVVVSVLLLSCNETQKENDPDDTQTTQEDDSEEAQSSQEDDNEDTQSNQDKNDNCEYAQFWDYPVKPDTEEWKQLTYQEKVNICQIPDTVLFCLSTDHLTDLCLQKPLIRNIFYFNTLDLGLDQQFKESNGLRELYKRRDVDNCLIARYNGKIDSLSFLNEENSDFEKSLFLFSIHIIEALISRIERQDNSIENLVEILKNLVMAYEVMSKYDNIGIEYNFFARAHIIIKICEPCLEEIPRGKFNFVFGPFSLDTETVEIINNLSYKIIK